MTNEQLQVWLRVRGAKDEQVKSLLENVKKAEALYGDSAENGMALDHEDWLEEITGNADLSHQDQVFWFTMAVAEAFIGWIEASN